MACKMENKIENKMENKISYGGLRLNYILALKNWNFWLDSEKVDNITRGYNPIFLMNAWIMNSE